MVQQVDQERSEALAVRRPMVMGERGFEFDFESVQRFAQGLIAGGMVPKGITSPGAVVGLIEAGKELGLPPMYALANLTFTNGRLGIMGDAAKALIRRSGALEPGTDFAEEYAGDPNTPGRTCTVTAHRKGQPGVFSRSFSIGNAIAAKLVRLDGGAVKSRKGQDWIDYGPWSTYTDRMLMYRALGFLVRDFFSDILAGATITEELRDYSAAEEREVKPPAEPDPLLEAAAVDEQPVVAPTVPPVEAVEAEVVTQAETIPEDEVAAIRALEQFEGRITNAETRAQLDAAWSDGAALLTALSAKERKRLSKLYDEVAANVAA